jgi:hypothetical protein
VALVVAGQPLTGQSPSQREALDRLTDSLALVTDTSALLAHEAGLIAVARGDRDNPMVHLRLGITALRLAALRPERPHREDVLGEFTWASELAPEWPWPWYGVGLAESQATDRAEGFAGGLFVWLGLDRDRLAGAAFARALTADPTFVAGLLRFAAVALEQRIDAPIASALTALRGATATPNVWAPELLVARGRLERRAGFPDSALRLFRRAEQLGSDDAMVWLEIARTLPRTAHPDTADVATMVRAYLLGARSDDAVSVAAYRADLEPIVDSTELAAFDAERGRARAHWLADFWRRRDAVDLRPAGARLAEHYRRWGVAIRDFRLPPFRRRYRWGVERYRSGMREVDDRGVVYLRHGEPTVRVVWPTSRPAFHESSIDRGYGSESWRYDWPDGQLTLHFVAREDPQDFRLIDGPQQLDVAGDVLAAHAHELPDVARLLRTTAVSADWVGEAVRSRGLAALAIATQTDSWQRRYAETLTARVQWLAAGDRQGRPLVHIVYAVDAAAVRAAGVRLGLTRVPVRVRAAALGGDGAVIATLDTTQQFELPSPAARFVAARAELPAAAGRVRVRLGLELSEDQGMVFPLDSIVVPAVGGTRLDLSALLLGRHGRSLPWAVTPADTAWLDAGGVYAPGDTVSVYAEVRGAARGRPLTATLELARRRKGLGRIFGTWRTVVTLREPIEAGPNRLTTVQRSIDLADLEPGSYRLTLTVDDGRTRVIRQRGLDVRR